MAYITPDDVPTHLESHWAFLFPTLGRAEEQQVVEQRLAENPTLQELPDEIDFDGEFEDLRKAAEFAW